MSESVIVLLIFRYVDKTKVVKKRLLSKKFVKKNGATHSQKKGGTLNEYLRYRKELLLRKPRWGERCRMQHCRF
mgnify:CR=1 FL=1